MDEIASRKDGADPLAAEHQVIEALVQRRPPEPDITQSRFGAMSPNGQLVTIFRHCLGGQHAQAHSLMAWIPVERRSMEPYRGFFSWAAVACAAAGERSTPAR